MAHPNDLKVYREGHGSYSVWQHGQRVGTVGYTGSHLDDYPWDWVVDAPTNGRATGVADTKRSAIDQIGYALGNFYGRDGTPRVET